MYGIIYDIRQSCGQDDRYQRARYTRQTSDRSEAGQPAPDKYH